MNIMDETNQDPTPYILQNSKKTKKTLLSTYANCVHDLGKMWNIRKYANIQGAFVDSFSI
jgi:hypothetical protein